MDQEIDWEEVKWSPQALIDNSSGEQLRNQDSLDESIEHLTASHKFSEKEEQIAELIARLVVFFHERIWPKDTCAIHFSDKQGEQYKTIGGLGELGDEYAKYFIYVPGIAKKFKQIQKTTLFSGLGSNSPDNTHESDAATTTLMIVAGMLRQCYYWENRWGNHNDSLTDFSSCFSDPKNQGKINNPAFKKIALTIWDVTSKTKFDFDATLIVGLIAYMCQNPEGISVNEIVKAITLSPKDVGI